MTNKNPLPSRFVYMSEDEQTKLIIEQLGNIFDSKLRFQQYWVDGTKRGSIIVSINFSIMTHHEDILKVTYNDEKKTLAIHRMTKNISGHLLKNKELTEMKEAFIQAVDRYALTDLFIGTTSKTTYRNANELVNDLLTRQHSITINLCTSEIEYTTIFHFNERNVKLIFKLSDGYENKITLDYYKKIKKSLKGSYGMYISETSKNVRLTKNCFEGFEHCFYDLYLKEKYNIPRKTKDALKVIEMLVI